jgi:hypothetical protein
MSTLQDIQDYDELAHKQWKAFGTMCGGLDVVKGVLAGELKITVEEVIRLLVDKNGRCIPTANQEVVTAAVRDPNNDYHLSRLAPGFTPVWSLGRWPLLFDQDVAITAEEFEARINALIAKVTGDKQIANLLKGAWYPVLLPKIPKGDYGTVLESSLLSAVKRGYEGAFPERTFVNHRVGELAKQVTVVDKRHEEIVTDMQSEQLVGIVCYPTQGFSVHAQRQMAGLMPEFISLLGAMDGAVPEALYPLQLSRDNNTPVRDCSAVQCQASDSSLCFVAVDSRLGFDCGYGLGNAHEICSGGLFLRG